MDLKMVVLSFMNRVNPLPTEKVGFEKVIENTYIREKTKTFYAAAVTGISLSLLLGNGILCVMVILLTAALFELTERKWLLATGSIAGFISTILILTGQNIAVYLPLFLVYLVIVTSCYMHEKHLRSTKGQKNVA